MRAIIVALLRLFPAHFRRAFGADMLATFDAQWRERRGLRQAVRTVADLASSAAWEQLDTQLNIDKREGDTPVAILWKDIRFALRLLWKRPGFTVVVILTLAVGIGASTAIFSLVDTVLLRPLPFHDAGQLVRVVDHAPGVGLHDIGMSVPELQDLADRSGLFKEISAVWPVDANLTGGERPERVELLVTSPNYFNLLGANAQLGRVFGPQDRAEGFAEAAVISDGLWQRLFGRDPKILGRTIRVDTDPYVIVGVMPPGFRHPGKTVATDVEMWGTAGFAADPFPHPPQRNSRPLPGAIARLRPGMTLQQTQARLNSFTAALQKQFPNDYRSDARWTVELEPLQDAWVGNVRPLLLMLLGAVTLMLLTGCVNIANLLLARATDRQREVAVRQALGASRARLLAQFLTESLMLSLAGGAIGVLAASATLRTFLAAAPAKIPRIHEVSLDLRVLSFALLVSVITGVLFGMLPALEASRVALAGHMQDGRGSGRSRRQSRWSGLLVVSEVAICLVLMMGAGLLTRSFWKLTLLNPGFNPENVLVARTWIPVPNDPKKDTYGRPEDRNAFAREVLRRARTLPGVTYAAMTTSLPLGEINNSAPVAVEGNIRADGESNTATLVSVSPDYFNAMQTPLMEGRTFAETDQRGADIVAVVDCATARHFWPGQSPVGKRFKLGRLQANAPWFTVVGMVGDIKHNGLDVDGVPHIYTSIYQRAGRVMSVVLRSTADPAALATALTQEVQAVDPDLPVFGVRTMKQMVETSLAQRRFSAALVASLAGFSLALAAIGVYGVLAFSVGQRTKEIGIRMALGARQNEVIRMVLWQGMRMILLGVAVGVVGALGFSRFLARLLYGVGPVDPIVFSCVPLALMAVALVASYVPARRATRIDPMEALRCE